MNHKSKAQWGERTVQQLVRYEALFKLLDDIQAQEDIELIAQHVARQWKYFANVSCWRLSVPKEDSFIVVDGFRGEAQVNEVNVPDQWDSYHFSRQVPHLVRMVEPLGELLPPEHLTEKAIYEIQIFPFIRSEQCIGVLSAAVRNQPFNELDLKFIRIFGSHFADRVSNILLRQHATKVLISRASRDALTGILNRGAIIEQLDKQFVIAKQSGKQLSIILADIDFFKIINDTHGHLVGDEVLRQVAQRLRENMFLGDHLGRYGGEEFLLVFCPCSKDEIEHAAERLRHVIAETLILSDTDPPKEVNLTISLGCASTESSQIDRIEQLIKRADDALYHAKHSGRNKVIFG